LRTISAQTPTVPRIGEAQRPQQEPLRLGQQPSLTFAPREIASIENAHDLIRIRLYGLGMLGPNGALPIHFTEQVRDRNQAKRDTTLNDFLDIFHHRAFTLFYRAWAQSQSAIGLDRHADETFTPYVARLVGDEPNELTHSPWPSHARWASISHRIRPLRDPEGLANTLGNFFGVSVSLEEFRLQWMDIEDSDKCRLGKAGIPAIMGQGAMLGEQVPDRQTRFRLVIGPLNLESYLRLTPQGSASGKDLPALIELVRAFVGFEYAWEVELLIMARAAPPICLGDNAQLGWSTWMAPCQSDDAPDISGMILDPENYFSTLGLGPVSRFV